MIVFKRGEETLQVESDAWTEMVTFLSKCGWNPSVPAYFFLASNYHSMKQGDAHSLAAVGQSVLEKALHDPFSVYPEIQFDMGKFSEVIYFASGGHFSINHTNTASPFRSFRYTEVCVGFPCVTAINQNEVIVGDLSGYLSWVTLDPFVVKNRVLAAIKVDGHVMACQDLQSVAIAPTDAIVCAVATRGGYAAVWDGKSDEVRRIHAKEGPVNSVAWDRRNGTLLIGTGYYALDSASFPLARIEAWNIDDAEPELLAVSALPGVCVDGFSEYQEDEDQFVCVTGMRSQNQGFVCVLDAALLRPQRFYEVSHVMAKRVECRHDLIFIANSGSIRAIDRRDGSETWVHKTAGTTLDFAHDSFHNRLFLSNGELISCHDAEVIQRLPAFDDCCSVALRPEGGFVGVSKNGMIGVWDDPAS